MGGPMQEFAKIFRSLPDPRAPNALHELVDILVIALAATLCGAKCATDMALFGQSKEPLLRQFLRLEHGIPSHDTFSRVFRALDPEAFERNFQKFMRAFAKANGIRLTGVVAVDGKALRGAYERSKSSTPQHMVNGFAVEAPMGLASRRDLHGKPSDKSDVRYYLLSKYMSAKRVLQTVRGHWGIENRLHWVLDVVFKEDGGRARKDNGPENLAVLRRFAINIIRAHPARISMRQKVKRAGWDDTFLLDLLSHMR